ncbi:hypothetical protein CW613_002144 [Vibrio mimicus]
MNRQRVVVSGGVVIEIIVRNTPSRIIHRAEQLVLNIMAKQTLNGMHPKVIQSNKSWLSYRVNHKYRLLVQRSFSNIGPFYCLSHTEFDHWVNHH